MKSRRFLSLLLLLLVVAIPSTARAARDRCLFMGPEYADHSIDILAESRFREVWDTPELKESAIGFFRKGLMRDAPKLADTFIGLIEKSLKETPTLTDAALFARLREFIRANEKAFTASYGSDNTARVEQRVNQIKDLVSGAPGSIIDIGAGEGQITSGLAQAWGIPKEKAHAIDVARYPANDRVNWHTYDADGKISTLKSDSIDLATILMVLHHTSNPEHTLREAHRLLKPGGTLIVRETDAPTPNARLFNEVMDGMYYKVFAEDIGVPLPNNYKSKKDWVALFASSGFTVEKSTDTDKTNPFTPVFYVLRKR